MYLTRSEIKLMRIFWNNNRPLSSGDLITINTDGFERIAALHSIINSLLDKGAIREAGIHKAGKSMGRMFAAEYSLEEYLGELIDPVHDFIDYHLLFQKILEKTDFRKEESGCCDAEEKAFHVAE